MINGWWIAPSILIGAVLWALFAWAAFASPLVITNDRGGVVAERVEQVRAMRQAGAVVRIKGRCYSTCTMLLGLPSACVYPSARMGFHGPQSQFYGVALPPAEFERWSRVMAGHYPPKLRAWFMQTARHITMSVVVMSGADAIRLGAKPCEGKS